MKKILLAVGFRQLEEYLQRNLKNEFKFANPTVYREGIIRSIGQQNPDIVVVRETLEGKENILSIVYEIRSKFPKIRVVFIAGKRDPGDVLLATLVSYGVYDILHGEKIQAQDVVTLLRKPNEYRDVQHLQPKPIFDERKNKVLFESPDVPTSGREAEKTDEKVIVKEVNIVDKKVNIDDKKDVEVDSDPVVNVEQTQKTVIPELTKKEVTKDEDQLSPNDKVEQVSIEVKNEEPASHAQVQTPNPIDEKTPSLDKKQEVEESKSGWSLTKLFGGGKIEKTEHVSLNGKQKILTFMGAKSGLGNSTIALNTAVQLAQRKNKVIYIEMNEKTPSVNYWYELGHLEDGIDSALIGLEANNFEKVKNAIIHSTYLAKQESDLQKNYKRFPSTLDFMFYSTRYLTKTDDEIINVDLSLTKELYLYLLFQMEYDYIILDVPSDLHNIATLNALLYSNKTFFTVTQDVSSIGNAVYIMNELSKRGIEVSKKMHFIVNRHEKAQLDIKEIIDWIKVDKLLTVPSSNKEFIDANFIGLPIILYSKNSHIKSAFQKIEKIIL